MTGESTKLLPLVQKCLRGKSLEAKNITACHEQSGTHLLPLCAFHSSALGTAGDRGDSVHPWAKHCIASLQPLPTSCSGKETYFQFPEEPQSTLQTVRQTLTSLPKLVFHSQACTIPLLGQALSVESVRKDHFGTSLQDVYLHTKEPHQEIFALS